MSQDAPAAAAAATRAGSTEQTAPIPPPAVIARGISQQGPWGRVYGPLDLTVAAGGLTVLRAPAGPGRTALQLTLAGRMKTRTGTLEVGGRSGATRIFAAAALAGIDDLDGLYPSVRVVDLLTERLRWSAPWYRRVRTATEADLDRIAGPVFGELPLPALDTWVEHLAELETLLLRIALANVDRPPLLMVADLDRLTDADDQHRLVRRLVDLGRGQTVLTCTANPLDPALGHREEIPVRLDPDVPDPLGGNETRHPEVH